ncbi:MAG: hypothetical protein IAI48_11425, partial [Candidatus Eremiobacteraeota bacterium]|nr:hypothetical protein [Candidatus Eremiobacteraeota bacterium]
TYSLAEFVPREGGIKPRGGFSAHAACALGAGIAGAAIAGRNVPIETLIVTCLAVAALAAVAYAGFFSDGIPLDVPIGALAIVVIASVIHGLYTPIFAAAVTGGPFLITALIAPDKRASLRDGTVAAIGGSILGLKFGVGATLLGSIAGVISFKAIASSASQSYAPYLASACGIAIVAYALLGGA